MSLNIENLRLAGDLAEMDNGAKMLTKITYARDFLLSLSELDVCKRLPTGFDKSILSELEDASQERQRVSGSFSSHGFRRTEYGSSPPTRGESSNYSRGIHGRWDSRSSGCSDKDSDSLTELDTDPGRCHSNQTRRGWQLSDHDGLLGSGSFPRPSGYTAGVSGSKFRATKTYQPNKNSEPYNPPRPYKAVPHLKRDTKDSYNDETFGSSDCTDEDRVEEERKRRASFELMRKEQLKTIHEKKSNPENKKEYFDITTLLDDPNDEQRLMTKKDTTGKSSAPPQAPTCRPLVPPGFANTPVEKNLGSKSLSQPHGLEVLQLEDTIVNTTGCRATGTASVHTKDKRGEKLLFTEKPEENAGTPASASFKDVRSSCFPEIFRVSDKAEVVEFGGQKESNNDISSDRSQDHSAVIMEKIFGGALTLDGSSTDELVLKRRDGQENDIRSPHFVQSSKFVQWFEEEDQNPVTDKPSDLLSLTGSGEICRAQSSDGRATEHIAIINSVQNPELAGMFIASPITSCTAENTRQLNGNTKQEVLPPVLTCEDLEQKILLEASESSSIPSSDKQGQKTYHEKIGQPKAAIDDHATLQLRSLLQVGTGPEDITASPNMDMMCLQNMKNNGGSTTSLNSLKDEHGEINSKSGNALTLEALFGTAFMRELQTVGAPVSTKRGSVGESVSVEKTPLEPVRGATSDHTMHQSNALSNQMHKTRTVDIREQGLVFCNSRKLEGSFQLQSGSDVPTTMPLPENDSLLTANDASKLQILTSGVNPSIPAMLTSSNAQVDFVDRLAILNSIPRDKRSGSGGLEDAPFFRGPRDMKERDMQYNLHRRPSAPQLHSPQFNHGGQPFQSLDSSSSNINSRTSPKGIIHNISPDTLLANVVHPSVHHPPGGLTRFDLPPPHTVIQQMQVPGSYTSPHMLGGIPQGTLPPHPSNQVPSLIPELNPLQGLHLGHRQPNFGGPQVPLSAPHIRGGDNHSEALQRLMNPELRSNPKQIHPFPAVIGNNPAMYGHQLDMGLGYR